MKILIQVILLFSVLLGIVVGGWYWLERVNVLSTTALTGLVGRLTEKNQGVEEIDLINDTALIDKLRLEKKEAEIKQIQIDLVNQNKELEQKSEDIANQIATLEIARSDLEAQKKSLNEIRKNFENKNEKVREVANALMNMPPQNAVNILVEFDDLLLIDTLIAVNVLSLEQGAASVVPYWLSLMDPKRAGTVQKKLVSLNR